MIAHFYDDYGRYSGSMAIDLGAPLPENATFISPPNEVDEWIYKAGVWVPVPTGPLAQLYNIPPVPQEVSNIQAFAAIKYFGLLPDVKAYMAALPEDDLDRVTWEKATVFKRTSPTLQTIATAFSLTDPDLDAMFSYAATVEV